MADKEHAPDLPAEIIEQIFIWIKDDFEAIACAQLISKNLSVVLQDKLKINIEDIQISDGKLILFSILLLISYSCLIMVF